MADIIKQQIGHEVELVYGDRGEFTVWVGEQKVAEKGWLRFPSDETVISSVKQALEP